MDPILEQTLQEGDEFRDSFGELNFNSKDSKPEEGKKNTICGGNLSAQSMFLPGRLACEGALDRHHDCFHENAGLKAKKRRHHGTTWSRKRQKISREANGT
jgi:hypothetical protein